MNSEESTYMERFNALYDRIRDRIGNTGVVAAGFGLIALSFFIRTDIFGLLLDIFGALGMLFGIAVSVIGIVMLGIEKGWWNAPAALNEQPANPPPQDGAVPNPPPQSQPPAPHYAEAQPVPQPAAPPAPPQQPEYLEPPPAGTYAAPMQQPYAPTAYPPQPQQGGIPLPDFVIRHQGNILLAMLAIFLGGILWGIFAGILGAIGGLLLGDSFIRTVAALDGVTLALLSSIGAVGAGILGGVMAGQTGKAILAALLYTALSWAFWLVVILALFVALDLPDFLSSSAPVNNDLLQLLSTIDTYGLSQLIEYSLPTFVGMALEILISSIIIPTAALLAGAVIGSRIAMKRIGGALA